MKKQNLTISGKTTENKTVLGNVGYLCFTRGLPLEIVVHYFKNKNLVIDWVDYIEAAIKDGHNKRTICSKIVSAVGDVHGPDYAEQVKIRVEQYLWNLKN